MILHEVLTHSQLCCGLNSFQVQDVIRASQSTAVRSGDVVFRQDDPGSSMFVVIKGRVRIEVEDHSEEPRVLEHLAVGDHFGELAMLTGGRRVVTMTAVVDSELLEIDQDVFQRLLLTVPELAVNVCRTLGYRLRQQTQSGSQRRPRPKVIGMVPTGPNTHRLLPLFAFALRKDGERVEILSDNPLPGTFNSDRSIEMVPAHLSPGSRAAWIQNRLAQITPQCGHVLVNTTRQDTAGELLETVSGCEEVWWLVEPDSCLDAKKRLEQLFDLDPRLASRIHLVWVLQDGHSTVPTLFPRSKTPLPDFKVTLDGPTPSAVHRPSRHQQWSLSRLVHHVRGTRIGIALGGGAARGLAHLGVLRALERAGLFVDLISGTSVGALMALPYAFGWEPDFAVKTFRHDLTPGWLFRHIPRGSDWYMIYKFRTGGWLPMLRRHFGEMQLEHLHVPLSTVTVDLIGGRQIVRDQGDAVQAVLECINLPGISRPILRDGMALVDGAIFNNVPADLLSERGADVVIGIDVATRLSGMFAGNSPYTDMSQTRQPRLLETIMRANEVQDHEITVLRSKAIDLTVSVDTSAFEFADFTASAELADAGEQAMETMLPQLRQLLAEKSRSQHATDTRFVCGDSTVPTRAVS